MNELQLKKLNDKISYEEAKIYWNENKGYTSKLIKRLTQIGYVTVKYGSVYILKDKNSKEVVTGYSWEGYLFNIATIFR